MRNESSPRMKFFKYSGNFRVLLIHSGVFSNTSQVLSELISMKTRHKNLVETIMTIVEKITVKAVEILENASESVESRNVSSLLGTPSTIHEAEIGKLKDLLDMNHSLLQALGMCHEAISHIYRIVKKCGFSGKMSAMGGGGLLYVLIPPSASPSEIDFIKRHLRRRSYNAVEADVGVPGLTLHKVALAERIMETTLASDLPPPQCMVLTVPKDIEDEDHESDSTHSYTHTKVIYDWWRY